MNVSEKKISIIGAAKSGLAAAKTLLAHNAKIFISDTQSAEKLKAILINSCLDGKVSYEAEKHTDKILDADYIILSPGVKSNMPILLKAKEKGIPVIGEIEIAYQMSKGKRIAITGSNGKTTTTTLLSLICKKHFNKVFLGGNIGIPAMSFVDETDDDSIQVLEISSFQLESIVKFKPNIAIITNFFENHLDRYPNYKAYIDAKKRISLNMGKNDWIVLNADQTLMRNMINEVKCNIAWFGHKIDSLKPAVTIKNEKYVYIDSNGTEKELFPVSYAKIPGIHNMENIMCASMAAILANIPILQIESTVKEFTGVEHRLEFVANIDGVDYINDSKGTNCAASIIAMRACNKPLILIAGGRDKGTDLTDWVNAIRKYCKYTILYGEAKDRFRSALEGLVPLKIAKGFDEALDLAKSVSTKGDTVLLSPACSSYDLFPNFEIRGKHFKELVLKLKNQSEI